MRGRTRQTSRRVSSLQLTTFWAEANRTRARLRKTLIWSSRTCHAQTITLTKTWWSQTQWTCSTQFTHRHRSTTITETRAQLELLTAEKTTLKSAKYLQLTWSKRKCLMTTAHCISCQPRPLEADIHTIAARFWGNRQVMRQMKLIPLAKFCYATNRLPKSQNPELTCPQKQTSEAARCWLNARKKRGKYLSSNSNNGWVN